MTRKRAQVVAEIRARTALMAISGKRHRRRPVPRQSQPDTIRLSYFATLRHMIEDARVRVVRAVRPRFAEMVSDFGPTKHDGAEERADKGEHTGSFLGLKVPPGAAEAMAVPGGEPADDLHVTLFYAKGLTAEQAALVEERFREVWEEYRPIEVVVRRLGVFLGSSSSDFRDVLYARPESPELLELRRAFIARLAEDGVAPKSEHAFSPHITLKYLEPGEARPGSMGAVRFEVSDYAFEAGDPAVRTDAIDFNAFFDGVADDFFSAWTNSRFAELARAIASRTATFQQEQLVRQWKAMFGVDVLKMEPWLHGKVEAFTAENVSLVKSIPAKFFTQVESQVIRAAREGLRWEELADTIEERTGVAESSAKLVARDQVGKFMGELNAARQQELGVSRFIWRTARDNRVRESHSELEGKVFPWNDLPTVDGEPEMAPGMPVNCRCQAEPGLEDVVAELTEPPANEPMGRETQDSAGWWRLDAGWEDVQRDKDGKWSGGGAAAQVKEGPALDYLRKRLAGGAEKVTYGLKVGGQRYLMEFSPHTLEGTDVIRDYPTVTISTTEGGTVAEAQFARRGAKPGPDGQLDMKTGRIIGHDVRVDPEHRRRGLATAMYAFASKLTGQDISPGDIQTEEGEAFRAAWGHRGEEHGDADFSEEDIIRVPAGEPGGGRFAGARHQEQNPLPELGPGVKAKLTKMKNKAAAAPRAEPPPDLVASSSAVPLTPEETGEVRQPVAKGPAHWGQEETSVKQPGHEYGSQLPMNPATGKPYAGEPTVGAPAATKAAPPLAPEPTPAHAPQQAAAPTPKPAGMKPAHKAHHTKLVNQGKQEEAAAYLAKHGGEPAHAPLPAFHVQLLPSKRSGVDSHLGSESPIKVDQEIKAKTGAAFNAWQGSLSAKQSYAMSNYKGNGYHWMNNALRESSVAPHQAADLKAVTEALATAPETPRDVVVWRGIHHGELATDPVGHLEGLKGIIHDNGFVSTSLSAEVAKSFSGSNPKSSVLMRITMPAGTRVRYWTGEHELLVQRDAKFQIEKVYKTLDGFTVLDGSYIGSSPVGLSQRGAKHDSAKLGRAGSERFAWTKADFESGGVWIE